MREWVDEKAELAERLARGECGGDYGDAIVVLSSVISGIAAVLWPGELLDRKRFVETWWRYSDRGLAPLLISLPLLIEDLDEKGDFALADALRSRRAGMFMPRGFQDDLVTTGDRVDLSEEEVLTATPLPSQAVRRFAYPSLFYNDFRSAYVHEARIGKRGDSIVMSDMHGDITYSCFAEKPLYRINFSIPWLAAITRSIWSSAREDVRAGGRLPVPNAWWLTGSSLSD